MGGCEEEGLDGIIIENFGDAPFWPGQVPPHVPACMAELASAVRREVGEDMSLGINVLRNDAPSAVAVAMVSNADFIRVNVHVGAAWTDQGLIQGRAPETLLYRRQLGCEGLSIAADVRVKHASPAGVSSMASLARDTAYRGKADMLIVTGEATGGACSTADLRFCREAVPDKPVWVGSGVSPGNLSSFIELADAAIVGTFLHQESRIERPLSKERVQELKAERDRALSRQ